MRAPVGSPWRWSVAAVLVIAALALWRWRGHDRPPVPADPSDALTPEASYAQAVELGRAGRHLASLPYFARAGRDLARDFAEFHLNLATACYNASVEYRGGPRPIPATRSSVERVALMRQALGELERVRTFPLPPRDRAAVSVREAEMLAWWGFPEEALHRYRRAAEEAPGWDLPGRRAAALDSLLDPADREGSLP